MSEKSKAPAPRHLMNLLLKAIAEAGEGGLNTGWFIYTVNWQPYRFGRIRTFLLKMFPDKIDYDDKAGIIRIPDQDLRETLIEELKGVPSVNPPSLAVKTGTLEEFVSEEKESLSGKEFLRKLQEQTEETDNGGQT